MLRFVLLFSVYFYVIWLKSLTLAFNLAFIEIAFHSPQSLFLFFFFSLFRFLLPCCWVRWLCSFNSQTYLYRVVFASPETLYSNKNSFTMKPYCHFIWIFHLDFHIDSSAAAAGEAEVWVYEVVVWVFHSSIFHSLFILNFFVPTLLVSWWCQNVYKIEFKIWIIFGKVSTV